MFTEKVDFAKSVAAFEHNKLRFATNESILETALKVEKTLQSQADSHSEVSFIDHAISLCQPGCSDLPAAGVIDKGAIKKMIAKAGYDFTDFCSSKSSTAIISFPSKISQVHEYLELVDRAEQSSQYERLELGCQVIAHHDSEREKVWSEEVGV